jgi:hypothetical protein
MLPAAPQRTAEIRRLEPTPMMQALVQSWASLEPWEEAIIVADGS